jgi:imidazolonepropionase-like amidohydrolase
MKKDADGEKYERSHRLLKRIIALKVLAAAAWATGNVMAVLHELSRPHKPFEWKPQAGGSVLLKGADVIDVARGRRLRERGILYRDGRITEIVPTRELENVNADRVFDCRGLVAIPGLINSHCHTMMPGAITMDYDLGLSLMRQMFRNIEECPVHGVTTVRDAASMPLLFNLLGRKIENLELLGPRMIGCGSGLKTPGGYPDFSRQLPEFMMRKTGQFNLEITDPQSGRRAVKLLVEQGARFIKLAFDEQSLFYGHKKLTVPDDDTVRAVIDEAHRAGLRVCVHQTLLNGFRKALRTGVDDFEHIPNDGPLTDAEVDEFIKGDHHLTPTMIVAMCIGIARDGDPVLERNPLAEWLQKTRERLQRQIAPAVAEAAAVRSNDRLVRAVKSVSGKPRFNPLTPFLCDPANSLSGHAEANVMKLYEAGAKICCGNDGGVQLTWPGTLFLELEILHQIGIPTDEVLRAATVNGADLVGMKDELGSLERGKAADIVLLSADPLADISAVEQVEAVFRSGVLVHYGPGFSLFGKAGAV